MDANATGSKVSPTDIAGHLKPANVSWVQVPLSDGRGVIHGDDQGF